MVDSVEAIQAPKPGEAISSTPTRENPRQVNPGSEESVLKSPKNPIPARSEWTDELHNLSLSSMDSSFLDQLYNNENRSNDLLGCLPIVTRNPTTKGLALGSNCLVSCQRSRIRTSWTWNPKKNTEPEWPGGKEPKLKATAPRTHADEDG
ncbi:hypothetical protein MUK42_20482 [Musa troglodytarum]|uniref:Uncharacterized protein n=1 Tax=Musa troglodytarum TaxID=320322 RepID=A0A9E7G3B2_9LILI|nr:hypothetical protein MUK42_20482 [Musa troglodytarum]